MCVCVRACVRACVCVRASEWTGMRAVEWAGGRVSEWYCVRHGDNVCEWAGRGRARKLAIERAGRRAGERVNE